MMTFRKRRKQVMRLSRKNNVLVKREEQVERPASQEHEFGVSREVHVAGAKVKG